MGTFWDAPCKNPTCSRAPERLLSQEAAEIPCTTSLSHAGRLLRLSCSRCQAVAEHVRHVTVPGAKVHPKPRPCAPHTA